MTLSLELSGVVEATDSCRCPWFSGPEGGDTEDIVGCVSRTDIDTGGTLAAAG